jgi:hypothetical protein
VLPAYSYAYTSQALSLLYQCLQQQLLQLSKTLTAEQQRHVCENLTEEELTVFDILTRPAPVLSAEERGEIKKVPHILLERLKSVLTLDWRNVSMHGLVFGWRLKTYSMKVFPVRIRQNCTRVNVRRCLSTFMRTTLVRASVCTRRPREVRRDGDSAEKYYAKCPGEGRSGFLAFWNRSALN